MGKRQAFSLPLVNGVCLKKVVGDDEVGKHVIRLEGIGFYLDIAEDISDDQRVYIALFLLQKRLRTP